MKKVVSVVTAPFRAIIRVLLGIVRRLRGLGKPFAKLGTPFVRLSKLRGRPLVIALVVAAVVVVVAVIALRPGPDEEAQVRETLDRYTEATRDKDYQTLCDDLYASDLVERIRSAGLPCEVALRTGLEERRNPQLRVLALEVNGDQSLARVRSTAIGEVPSVDTVRLVKEGEDWRVASLAEPGATSPTP